MPSWNSAYGWLPNRLLQFTRGVGLDSHVLGSAATFAVRRTRVPFSFSRAMLYERKRTSLYGPSYIGASYGPNPSAAFDSTS